MRSRLSTALALATLALGAAASVALATPSSSSPIAKALTRSAGASSYRFTFSVTVSGSGVPSAKGITISGRGASDTRHGVARVSIDLGALAPLLGSSTGGSFPSQVDAIVVKNVLYLRLPALASTVGRGKEWLKLTLSKLPKQATGGANLSQLGSIDPRKLLAALTSSVSVSKVAVENVQGVSTTHYHVVVDVRKAVSGLPPAQRASALQGLKQAGVSTLALEVWIDRSSYLRRLRTTTDLKSATGSVAVDLSLDVFDYGAKVRVTVPPAAKVADGTALLSHLAGALGGGKKPGSGG